MAEALAGAEIGSAGADVQVRPVGVCDLAAAPGLWATLTAVCAGQPDTVVIDLASVGLIDMTCAGLLAGASRRVRSYGGEFRAVNPSDLVRRSLAVSGLNHLLAGR